MMKMNDRPYKIDSHELRINLSGYLKKGEGDTIYITRYDKHVAELRVYTDEIKAITELRIAERMLEVAEEEVTKVS